MSGQRELTLGQLQFEHPIGLNRRPDHHLEYQDRQKQRRCRYVPSQLDDRIARGQTCEPTSYPRGSLSASSGCVYPTRGPAENAKGLFKPRSSLVRRNRSRSSRLRVSSIIFVETFHHWFSFDVARSFFANVHQARLACPSEYRALRHFGDTHLLWVKKSNHGSLAAEVIRG